VITYGFRRNENCYPMVPAWRQQNAQMVRAAQPLQKLAIDTPARAGLLWIEHRQRPSLLSQLWRKPLTPSSSANTLDPVSIAQILKTRLGPGPWLCLFYSARLRWWLAAEVLPGSRSGKPCFASRRSERAATRCAWFASPSIP